MANTMMNEISSGANMKTLLFKSISMTVLIASALSLIACGKSDNKSETRNGANRSGVQGAISQTCSNGQSSVGAIYDNTASQSEYQDRLSGLVSAILDPSYLGRVSNRPQDQTGIDLRVKLQLNSSGQVANGSAIQFAVHDEFSLTTDTNGQQIAPYSFSVSASASGYVDRSRRRISIVFEDQYGQVKIDGSSSDGITVIGTVEFSNKTHYAGQTPMNGILGQFSLPACAVF